MSPPSCFLERVHVFSFLCLAFLSMPSVHALSFFPLPLFFSPALMFTLLCCCSFRARLPSSPASSRYTVPSIPPPALSGGGDAQTCSWLPDRNGGEDEGGFVFRVCVSALCLPLFATALLLQTHLCVNTLPSMPSPLHPPPHTLLASLLFCVDVDYSQDTLLICCGTSRSYSPLRGCIAL